MSEHKLPLASILAMRRHMRAMLPLIDLFLARYNPVCQDCFYNRALVDKCECKKGLDKDKQNGVKG